MNAHAHITIGVSPDAPATLSKAPSHQGPTQSTKYVIAICRSDKTLQIAKMLYLEHGVHAWAPRIVKNKPRKGEKRVRPALPGFVFIPRDEYDKAEKQQKRLLVPAFKALITNETVSTCTHAELKEFEKAISNTIVDIASFDSSVQDEFRVGDEIIVSSGPLKGVTGIVDEIYISKCLWVTIKSDMCPAIRMPVAFISLI